MFVHLRERFVVGSAIEPILHDTDRLGLVFHPFRSGGKRGSWQFGLAHRLTQRGPLVVHRAHDADVVVVPVEYPDRSIERMLAAER